MKKQNIFKSVIALMSVSTIAGTIVSCGHSTSKPKYQPIVYIPLNPAKKINIFSTENLEAPFSNQLKDILPIGKPWSLSYVYAIRRADTSSLIGKNAPLTTANANVFGTLSIDNSKTHISAQAHFSYLTKKYSFSNISLKKSTPLTPSQWTPLITDLTNQLKPLKAIENPKITITSVSTDNLATGTISYSIDSYSDTNFQNMPFTIQLIQNKQKIWKTNDINSLINAPRLGRFKAMNDINIANTTKAFVNRTKTNPYHDPSLSFNTYGFNNIAGWDHSVDHQTSATSKAIAKKITTNKSLITTKLTTTNQLAISFPSYLTTTSVTDHKSRIAYRIAGVNKSYDLTKVGAPGITKATFTKTHDQYNENSGITATLTEATKQYLAHANKTSLPKNVYLKLADGAHSTWDIFFDNSKTTHKIAFNFQIKVASKEGSCSWTFTNV